MFLRAAGWLQRSESALKYHFETRLSVMFSFKKRTARGTTVSRLPGNGSGSERRMEPWHIFIIKNTPVHIIFGCDRQDRPPAEHWVN